MTNLPPPSASRFSSRVADYIRYRPSYPVAAVDYIIQNANLNADDNVADIGSGTGISTRLLLDRDLEVYAVEPNDEMREAAEELLGTNARFHSVNGTADSTTLPDSFVKLVLCAQAFHWFATPMAVAEFQHIAAPDGSIALLWNARETTASRFLREYDDLLHRFSIDYASVNHENVSAQDLNTLFGQTLDYAEFDNHQRLDWAGLQGRALSSSYVPGPGQSGHKQFLSKLRELFMNHQIDDSVTITYKTRVYLARAHSISEQPN